MFVNKAFKFKLGPTAEQEVMLNKTVGCCRFVYNYFLKLNINQYEKDKTFVFNHQMVTRLPELKKQFSFLGEVFLKVYKQQLEIFLLPSTTFSTNKVLSRHLRRKEETIVLLARKSLELKKKKIAFSFQRLER